MVKVIEQGAHVEQYTSEEIYLILESVKGISQADKNDLYNNHLEVSNYPNPPSEIESILIKQLLRYLEPEIASRGSEGTTIMSSHDIYTEGQRVGFNTPYSVSNIKTSIARDRTSYTRNMYDIYPMDRIRLGNYSAHLQRDYLANTYGRGITIQQGDYNVMYADVIDAYQIYPLICDYPQYIEAVPEPVGIPYEFKLDSTLQKLFGDALRYKRIAPSTEAFMYDMWDSFLSEIFYAWMDKKPIGDKLQWISNRNKVLSETISEYNKLSDVTILMLNYDVISREKFRMPYSALTAVQRKEVLAEYELKLSILRAPQVYDKDTFSKLWSNDTQQVLRAFTELQLYDTKHNTSLQDNICQHKWDELQALRAHKSREDIEKHQLENYVNRVMHDKDRKLERTDLFCKLCGELIIKQKFDLVDDLTDAAAVYIADDVSKFVHKSTLIILTKYVIVERGKRESHAAIVRDMVVNAIHDALNKSLHSSDVTSANMANIYVTVYVMALVAAISISGALSIREIKIKRGGGSRDRAPDTSSLQDEKKALALALTVCYDKLGADLKAINMSMADLRKMLIKAYSKFRGNRNFVESEVDERQLTIMNDPVYRWLARIKNKPYSEIKAVTGFDYTEPGDIFANSHNTSSEQFNAFMMLYTGNANYVMPPSQHTVLRPIKSFVDYKPVRDFHYTPPDDALLYNEMGQPRKWDIYIVDIKGVKKTFAKGDLPPGAKIVEVRSTDGAIRGKVDSKVLAEKIIKHDRKTGFYIYYKTKCPVKNYHEGNPCKWCGYKPEFASEFDDAYFSKYDSVYTKTKISTPVRLKQAKIEPFVDIKKQDPSPIKKASDIFNYPMEKMNTIGSVGERSLNLLSYNGMIVSYYALANTKLVPIVIFDLGIKDIKPVQFVPCIGGVNISDNADNVLAIMCKNLLIIHETDKKLAATLFKYILEVDDRYRDPNMAIVKDIRREAAAAATTQVTSGAAAESFETEEVHVEDTMEQYYNDMPDFEGAAEGENENLDFEFD